MSVTRSDMHYRRSEAVWPSNAWTLAAEVPKSERSTGVKGFVARFTTRICEICGESYEPTGAKQKICGKVDCVRASSRQRSAQYAARQRSLKLLAEPIVFAFRKCDACGDDFQPTTARQKYCVRVECRRQRNLGYRTRYLEKPDKREQNKDSDRKRARKRARLPTVQQWRRNYLRKRKYGIDEAAFNDLLTTQRGCCLICGVSLNSPGIRRCVDHDHECCPGEMTCGRCVRGILCQNCNFAEGFIRSAAKLAGRTVEQVLMGLFVYTGQWDNRPTDAEPRVPGTALQGRHYRLQAVDTLGRVEFGELGKDGLVVGTEGLLPGLQEFHFVGHAYSPSNDRMPYSSPK